MSMRRLLTTRRFLPLFATQFLGAFNDNLFRSAMLFLIAFRLAHGDPHAGAVAASLSGGVFILPFLLFSGVSGSLSDRIDKARVVRIVKAAEVAIMGLAAAGLLWRSQPLLYAALFAMGTHSTLFGPVKYAILPQHLHADELVAGTALVEAATFLAILAGQIAGGLLPTPAATAAMVGVAVAGLGTGWLVPPALPPSPSGEGSGAGPLHERHHLRTGPSATSPLKGRGLLESIWRDPILRAATIGISWFFSLGAVLTQQFVALVAALNAAPAVAALLLALFSVGVAIGSLAAGRVMRGRVTARTVRPAARALAVFTAGLAAAVGAMQPGAPVGIAGFLTRPGAVWLALDLLALSIAAGLYVVPLYALLQTASDPAARARTVAANNVANALAMVLVSLLSLALLAAGAGLAGLFAALALLGLVAAWAAGPLGSS